MLEIVFRPLPGWPKAPTAERRKSDLLSDFNKVLSYLTRELKHLKSKGVVIQTGHKEQEISVTIGRPLAGTTPSFPGVIVMADTEEHGALNWTCDLYRGWVSNLRNISLYMERQRLLAGQGIGTGKEAYAGHKMLPGPITGGGPTLTIDAAARFVGELTGRSPDNLLKSKQSWTTAYREAAAMMHPDGAHPEPEKWAKLQDAKTLIDGLHQGRR